MLPIITLGVAEKILGAAKNGKKSVSVSLDLGKGASSAMIDGTRVKVGDGAIPLEAFSKVKENTCYVMDKSELKAVELFSQGTNLYYKLRPTTDWPTITLSSVPMHRFKHLSPRQDTQTKIEEISPVKGVVLDTCCGLGYTAIMASRGPERVDTFERDENVLKIASYNPYSQELFDNPKTTKIFLHKESIFGETGGIKSLSSENFDRIIHDPPTVSFAPELYSAEFYKQLFRVMKRGGILYHYCPAPGKTKGRELFPSVEKRLRDAGFKNVKYSEKSSGIRALKP